MNNRQTEEWLDQLNNTLKIKFEQNDIQSGMGMAGVATAPFKPQPALNCVYVSNINNNINLVLVLYLSFTC